VSVTTGFVECCLSLVVDRNVRIDSLQKHVEDLLRQREKLQQQETQLHERYERVSHCDLLLVADDMRDAAAPACKTLMF